MPDADVDALAKEVVDWYVEWNPIFATYIGIHGRDHLMPKGTADAELEERARIVEYLRRVEAIDRKGLSPGKRVDWGVMRNAFRLWIFGSEELGLWQSMPQGAQTVGDASSRSSCAPSRRCRVGSRASSDGWSVPPRSSRRRRAASVRPSRSGRKSPSRRRPGSLDSSR